MAGHRYSRKALEIIHIFTVLNTLNIIPNCVSAIESHGQAFIQTDNELRYMGDHEGIPSNVMPGHSLQDMAIQDTNSQPPIRFEPPMLDFKEQPLGMPHMEQVTVHNPDPQNSLHLLSISGSTLHFHCSFFQDKMVPPSGNTTFDVVFLARQLGIVENTLYIHTSQGSFKYQVFGVGLPNPYRIRPLIGAKVPVNSSFNPLILMHNPHSSTLQVVEMYSSGGDLHLELPTGEKEAPQKLWEIPPFETKPVMRASFVGRVENNHTAFIRIKTNREKKDEILVLPVEVEVTSSPGIFSPLEMLDFGILRTTDSPKMLRLNLLNSGSKPVHISSITVSPPNSAITIDFRQVKLQPDIIQTTPVALIYYNASKATTVKQLVGKIVVKSKTGQYKVSIPYQATVLYGSLNYDTNKTRFFTGRQSEPLNITRSIPFTNAFNFTCVIYNASLAPEARPYFSIENATWPTELKPQQTLSPFKLKFHPNTPELHLTTQLVLYTNASTFYIPLVVYNGKLKVVHHRPEIYKGQLDFGTMGIGERRSMTFTLQNDNPVDIVLSEFGANMANTQVELLGVERGNSTTLTRPHDTSLIETNPLVLNPYHYAVFSVNLVAPKTEGSFAAEVIIVTQHEYVYIPITLRTAVGSLFAIPDKIHFENCFPSKICSHELMINSTFDQPMDVQSITFQPNDSRFYYLPARKEKITLHPLSITNIGKVNFEVSRGCNEDCFLGLPTSVPAGHQWLLGARLDKEVADTDQYLYTRFRQQWENIVNQHKSTVNVTIQLDTNQVRGFLFTARAQLGWPDVVNTTRVKFPLTQIGNLSVQYIMIKNPSDVPLLIQVLPLSLYPSPQTLVDLLSPSLAPDKSEYIEMDDMDVFTLQDLEKYSPNPINPISGLRRSVENTLGVRPHPDTIAMFVGPGSQVRARLGFLPKDDLSRSSLIIIRNNLTIVSGILVQGKGGRGELRFSNRKPGSHSPLQFEMTAEKQLKGCDRKKPTKSSNQSFTMKRTFTIRNTGQLPFYVHGFTINQVPCEGYGFKVLDCHGFDLAPNASKKIDIAFTPDFTMSRMRRTLSVLTSLGPAINFTLQATIPGHMLTKCAAALPRPPWEPILYYSTICIMAFLLFCILVASYFEADRIFTADIVRRRNKINSSHLFDKSRVFDLKTIAGIKQTPSVDKQPSPQPQQQPQSGGKTPPIPIVPPMEMSNGHVEFPTKKKSSSWSISDLFKLFGRNNSNTSSTPETYSNSNNSENNKAATSRTSSTYLPLQNNGSSNGNGRSVRTGQPPSSDNIDAAAAVSCSAPPDKNYYKNKKARATKRQHSDHLLNDVGAPDNRKIDPTMTNAVVGSKEDKSSYPNKTENSNKTSRNKDNQEEEVIKNNRRARRTKSLNNAIQDNSVKDKLRHSDLFHDEKDDTSSTTTDSSIPDPETSSARESTPEPQPLNKKPKTKKEKKKMEQGMEDEDAGDDDFVITSKSKAHKKIRVDRKSAYGGNIHCPSSLELPYKTKLEAQKESERNIAANLGQDKIRKVLKNRASKAKTSDMRSRTCSEASDGSSESPPPVWDMPVSQGDLSDLSSQTEQFASRLTNNKVPTGALRGPSPDSVSSGSSYSSVVSNGSTQQNSELNRGKLTEEAKKNANLQLNITDKHPGAIGSKAWAATSGISNTWLGASGKDTLASGYGLHGVPEATLSPMTPETPTSFSNLTPPADNMMQYMYSGLQAPQPPTMMQKLQADRRKRLMDYQQKVINGEEWPGFGLSMQPDSLWSQTMNNHDVASGWPQRSDSPPKPEVSKGLWDAPALRPGPGMANWQTSSIWSTAPSAAAAPVAEDLACTDAGPSAIPEMSGSPGASPGMPTFDPFSTLGGGSIWQPGSSVENTMNHWSFIPTPQDEDNM